MLEIIVENYKPIGYIIIYTLVLLVSLTVVFYKMIHSHVVENWAYYRSNPLLLPIAGFIYTPPGYTAMEYTKTNIINVIWSLASKTLNVLMLPIYPIISMFLKIMKNIGNSLNGIRQQMSVMRNFLFKIFENIYMRLQTSIAAITFYMLKLRESLKRSFGLLNLMVSSLEHSYIFMQSLVTSPLVRFGEMAEEGGRWMSRFALPIGMGDSEWRDQFVSMCFHPDTPIVLNDNTIKAISNIKINDVLANGNRVLATIKSKVSGKMYKLDNDIVSSNHRILFNNKWIRVKNHPNSALISYPHTEVYCLVTLDGTIQTNHHTYKDYMDTHSLEINREVQKKVSYYINNRDIYINGNIQKPIDDLLSGLDPKIRVNPLSIKGRIEIAQGQLSIYNLYGYKLSALVLVKHEKKWIRVYEHPDAKYLGKNEIPYVHYVSWHNNNSILLDSMSHSIDVQIKDFCEYDNTIVEEEINLYLDKNL